MANQVTVDVYGDPLIRIVDLTTGRTTVTLKLSNDVKAVQFDASGRYFAILLHGGAVELWRCDPLRKELGLLRGLGEGNLGTAKFAGGFLDDNGRFLMAANDAVQIYQIGTHSYVDLYEFGHPQYTYSQSPYSFIDVSHDGKTVLYAGENGSGGPLVLEPTMWERKLCDILGRREFTADERTNLPVQVPAQPVCPGR